MLTIIFCSFCIFIIFYLAIILQKKENRTPNLVVSILCLIASILGIIYSTNIDDNNTNPDRKNVYIGRDLFGGITYINNYSEIKDEVSLAGAYRKIELKDYLAAADIYLQILEQDSNNAKALCNLGYIFEKGLDTEVDFNKALEYYDKAIQLGNTQALHNKLAMYLSNDLPIEPVGDLIRYGIEIEDIDICKFVFASLQYDKQIDENTALMFCKTLDEFILEDLWAWRDAGLIKEYSTPTNTRIVHYTLVSNGSESQGNYHTALYKIYQIDERYCPYINLLKAGFDK